MNYLIFMGVIGVLASIGITIFVLLFSGPTKEPAPKDTRSLEDKIKDLSMMQLIKHGSCKVRRVHGGYNIIEVEYLSRYVDSTVGVQTTHIDSNSTFVKVRDDFFNDSEKG